MRFIDKQVLRSGIVLGPNSTHLMPDYVLTTPDRHFFPLLDLRIDFSKPLQTS